MQELIGTVTSAKNHLGFLHLLRPLQSRFLNMLHVANRLHQLKDALLLYYFAFLTTEEQKKHQHVIDEIFDRKVNSEEERRRIKFLQRSQARQQQSSEGCTRKDKILSELYHNGEKFFTQLNLYRGILPKLEVFVKKFQAEKPLVHSLHSDMFHLVREFLVLFMKSDHVPDVSVKDLLKVDVEDSQQLLTNKRLFVGAYAHLALKKAGADKWVADLYCRLRTGYVAAAKMLLEKLPLDNTTIKRLSCLDPDAHKDSLTGGNILKLAESLPNVIEEEHLGSLDSEMRSFSVDNSVAELAQNSKSSEARIDTDFWVLVFKLQEKGQLKYPLLTKLVKALLSVFCGPVVESSFNLMDDIIRPDRSRLTVENYEAQAIVKSTLKAKGVTATQLKVSPQVKGTIIRAYSKYSEFLADKKAKKADAKERRLQQATAALQRSAKSGRTVCRLIPSNRTATSASSTATSASRPASSTVTSASRPDSSTATSASIPASSTVTIASRPASSTVTSASRPASSTVTSASRPASSTVTSASRPASSTVTSASRPASSTVTSASRPDSSTVTSASRPASSTVTSASRPDSSTVTSASRPASSTVTSASRPASSTVTSASRPASSTVTSASRPASSTVTSASRPASSTVTSASRPASGSTASSRKRPLSTSSATTISSSKKTGRDIRNLFFKRPCLSDDA